MQDILKDLRDFAEKHDIAFRAEGEIGFGRPCTGFIYEGNYIAYNPIDLSDPEYGYVFGESDDRLYSPKETPNSYHKSMNLAVLVQGSDDGGTSNNDDWAAAHLELHFWIKHLEAQGEVEIVDYSTGATGMQAVFSGVTAKAVRIKEKSENVDK